MADKHEFWEAKINEHLDGVSGELEQSLREHAASCADCSSLLSGWAGARESLFGGPAPELSDFFWARFNARLREESCEKEGFEMLRMLIPAGAMTAAAVGCWLWLAAGSAIDVHHPLDALIIGSGDDVAEESVLADAHSADPAALLGIDEEDSI